MNGLQMISKWLDIPFSSEIVFNSGKTNKRGVRQDLDCTMGGTTSPLEGVDKFYCRWGSMRGDIVVQIKDIFLG